MGRPNRLTTKERQSCQGHRRRLPRYRSGFHVHRTKSEAAPSSEFRPRPPQVCLTHISTKATGSFLLAFDPVDVYCPHTDLRCRQMGAEDRNGSEEINWIRFGIFCKPLLERMRAARRKGRWERAAHLGETVATKELWPPFMKLAACFMSEPPDKVKHAPTFSKASRGTRA